MDVPYKIDSPLHRIFLANMRARREELDLTQAELAEEMGISQPSYAQIEYGRRSPSIEIIERVAKALKTTPVQLLMQDAFAAISK